MPNWKKIITSGSDASLNTLVVSNGITGSLQGTSSWAENALTASYLNTLNQDLIFNGSLTLNGTASIAYLNVTYESASVIYSSGSNQFGDDTNDNQTLIGTVEVSGSLQVNGNTQITGSLLVTQSYISTVDYVDFTVSLSPPVFNTGRLHWTDDTKTLQLDTDVSNFELEIGHQSVIRGRNTNSFTITKGTVVYINGESGNRPTFATASWEGDPSSAATIGIVAQNINASQTGYAVTNGLIRGINTNAFAPGTSLYLSSSGQYSDTPAISPLHEVRLGKTVTQAVDGIVYVDIQNGYEIGELHDVLVTSAAAGDLLTWNSGSLVWKNTKQLTGSYGLTGSLSATSFTGSLQGTSSWAVNALTASYINPLNQHVIITGSLTVSGSSTLRNIGPAEFTGSFDVTGSTTLNGTLNVDNKYYFINTLSELPAPVGNVITLADNATYLFTTTVDLLGNRLVCGQNTTLLGGSSENSRIKSTGLTTEPLISSSYSIPMRGLTIEADIALSLIASGSTQAIDWFGVNFTNCPTVGVIKDYSNVIMTDCAFLEAANCVFDGTIGTVGFVTCLFNGRSGQTIMTLSPTGSITRRFRPIYSSFIALSGETALNIPEASIVNAEGFILDTCNFSGGGTYISGANTGSLKSLFVNNVGITNTTNVGHYYMINNTTNTTIGVPNVNVWVKAAGTTTEGIGNSPKWETNGNNRLDYSGSIAQDFKFTAVGTVQSAANNQVISVGVAKNGTIQDESEVTVRTATSNQPYPFAVQDLVQVAAGDYIEVFVRNTTSTDIRVGDLNVIIDKIGS